MKPTHGLVPYTGIAPLELTIDHTGPMTCTVADNALLLEVIAGQDGLDPRQYAPRTDHYTAALGKSVAGLRIGVLKEGFDLPESSAAVDACVRAAAERFSALGAEVATVSVPTHADAVKCWFPIAYQGGTDLILGNGGGSNWMGLYDLSLMDASYMWRQRTHELADIVKFLLLLGRWMGTVHRGQFYAKAQNLRRRMRQDYQRVFDTCDVLLFPTTPFTAAPIPPADCSRADHLTAAGNMAANTLAANLTHNPAISIPAGTDRQGMPIGMSLVGRHHEEATLYRAAHAFEQAHDWRAF